MLVENLSGEDLKVIIDHLIKTGRDCGAIHGDVVGLRIKVYDADASAVEAKFDVPEGNYDDEAEEVH